MKEETKNKFKKIAKVVGFTITFGFAVFGALCAAMLISNGSKKDDIKMLDSSLVLNVVRSERNIKPRKAPDISGAFNYATRGRTFERVTFAIGGSSQMIINENDSSEVLILDKYDLPNGYYYFDFSNNSVGWVFHDINVYNAFMEVSAFGGSNEVKSGFSDANTSGVSQYFYLNWDSVGYDYISFRWSNVGIYLIDTLELPSTSSVYLGENWNPLKAFGDTLSEKGGFLLTDESWTANSSTFKNFTISGLLFKYEGVVYDRIYMIARPLNSSAYPYVDSSGAIVERAITQNSGPNEIYVLDYVGFGQSWLYDGLLPSRGLLKVMVGGKADTPSPSGKLPYNGSLQWVTSSRTIQIIDNKGTTTGRYDNRFSYMTDLEFINMLSEYESESIDVVNGGQMFGLFTNAFDSLLPILSISVLPNITLGMLLFIPLIGAIIVIIIRVVKK